MLKKGKLIAYIIWIVVMLSLLTLYLLRPEIFTSTYLFNFIESFQNEMLIAYILLSFIRGFFFIPSTPFVIVGGLLFPDQLLLVLIISMSGIMFSATALYYFSDLLGFSKYLNKKFPSKIDAWKSRLASSKSVFFIAGWSLLPVVPTDLICYVTGVMRTSFKNLFIGVFIGELLLCSVYVYSGASLFEFIQ